MGDIKEGWRGRGCAGWGILKKGGGGGGVRVGYIKEGEGLGGGVRGGGILTKGLKGVCGMRDIKGTVA